METYKNQHATVEERIQDLMSRMTLEEKVAQLGALVVNDVVDGDNQIVRQKLENLLNVGCGQISRSNMLLGEIEPETAIALVNELQTYLINETRLGIPAILHEECLNGVQVKYATAFPQSIGAASTWNDGVVQKMGDILRQQLRAGGATQGLAPVLDIVRDARWGRIEETYGEDPYLTSALGTAYVKGLQGNNLAEGVIATAKHFLGYGASEGGMNCAPTHINSRELREVYGRPFEAAIREAGLASVMNSYTELDGIPSTVSKELLSDILRDEFGFQGIVVSDYGAIELTNQYHRLSLDAEEVGIQALSAGMDVELPYTKYYGDNLVKAVQEGKLDIAIIEQSVERVLRLKFQLGLFENPYGSPDQLKEIYTSEESKKTANQVAKESIVLLKNEQSILPLNKDIQSIAIIGPNADSVRNLLGDYNYASGIEGQLGMFESFAKDNVTPDSKAEIINRIKQYEGFILTHLSDTTGQEYKQLDDVPKELLIPIYNSVMERTKGEDSQKKLKNMIAIMQEKGMDSVVKACHDIKSVREAIEAKVSPNMHIHYAKGCDIIGGSDEGFAEAIQAAQKSDIAIVVMGDKAGMDAGSTTGESRDRVDLNLPGRQLQLLKELHATGTPIVLVLINGRPLSLLWEHENIPAIVEAWLPGEQGADAIAEVLFGEYNPGGKLPISFPKSVGQVPVFYNHKPSGGRSQWQGDYVEMDTKPLYPFGYGLSYTTFSYSSLEINSAEQENITISVNVKNIGTVSGDEVVQLYMNQLSSTVTRPVKQLYGYKRLTLEPGAEVKVTFAFPISLIGFYNARNKFVVEPGHVKVFIGSSSNDVRAESSFYIQGDKDIAIHQKTFFSEVRLERL